MKQICIFCSSCNTISSLREDTRTTPTTAFTLPENNAYTWAFLKRKTYTFIKADKAWNTKKREFLWAGEIIQELEILFFLPSSGFLDHDLVLSGFIWKGKLSVQGKESKNQEQHSISGFLDFPLKHNGYCCKLVIQYGVAPSPTQAKNDLYWLTPYPCLTHPFLQSSTHQSIKFHSIVTENVLK